MHRKITAKSSWWFGGSLLIFCITGVLVAFCAPNYDGTLYIYTESPLLKLIYLIFALSGLSIPISVVVYFIAKPKKLKLSCLMLIGGLVVILFILALIGPAVWQFMMITHFDTEHAGLSTTYYAAGYTQSGIYNSYQSPDELVVYRCNGLGFNCDVIYRQKNSLYWNLQTDIQLMQHKDEVSLIISGETIFSHSK